MTGSRSTSVGMLGSGFMAHTYAECLARHIDDAHLVAVALGTRAPPLAEAYEVTHEPTAEALHARGDIDVVVVATPHSTHVELATAVAAVGKHLYLEKPMAVDVAGCDAIIEAGDGWEDVHEMPPFKLVGDHRDPVRLMAFPAQLAEFAADVCQWRTPAVGGTDGRAAVELVEAARISSERDAAVHLPLDVGP